MNNEANTERHAIGALVIHDADAKENRMLMRVTGYKRDGMVETVYVDDARQGKRKKWLNELKWLHNPNRPDVLARWKGEPPPKPQEPEEWRDIPGFDFSYQASNLGRIRREKAARNTPAGYVLSCQLQNSGYLYTTLWRKGKRTPTTVHSLVALAFLGSRPPGMQVNHKDGDRLNNRIANLEYCTASDNVKHSFNALGKKPFRPSGELSGTAKLTERDVLAIRQLAEHHSTRELADRYGVTTNAIRRIVRRKSWLHLP